MNEVVDQENSEAPAEQAPALVKIHLSSCVRLGGVDYQGDLELEPALADQLLSMKR